MLISFLFLHENICCGYSLEAPHRGASNEYPQHMFSWRNKKSIIWIPPLICSYGKCLGKAPLMSTAYIFVEIIRKILIWIHVCLFVLRFYGPVNPMGSCRARSVYLTTRLLGRQSSKRLTSIVHNLRQKLTTALLESVAELHVLL